MKTSSKILAFILAALCVIPAFASCKKDDEKEKVTAKVIEIELTEEDYAFGVDKDQPELLKSVNDFIAEIMKNGKFEEICNKYFGDGTPTPVESKELDSSKDQLVVATNAAFEPFEYKDGDKYLGIDMEIAALLAEKLNKELVITNMDFDSVCLSVGQHKCDIAMAGLTINEKRQEYVTFSDSYYKAAQKLIVKSNDTKFNDCKTKEDVEKILGGMTSDVKVGYQNGTTGEKYIKGDADWDFAGFKTTGVGYKNGSLAVQDMINGNIDYVVIDAAPAKFITEAVNKLS